MDKTEFIAYIQGIIDAQYAGLQANFAEAHGLSRAYVNDVLRGRRDPGEKILKAVGALRIVTYRIESPTETYAET